ncbi:Yip1 family protein [Ornithinibacillus sp. 4-3]|uniref:Yip1 family protein n=1 Tax=Ornithinibacillus sp. 4-3 TaxID=3231488 RepID=A0AB39HRY5_9BACI
MEEEKNVPKPSLLGMLTNPTEQFIRIKQQPIILMPMLIIIVLTIIGTWLSASNVVIPELQDVEIDQEMAALIDAFTKIGATIGGVIMPLLTTLISTVIYFLVAKIAQSSVSFKQLFSMNTFILLITAIGLIVNGFIYMLIDGTADVSPTSLGYILNQNNVIYNSIELFSIWNLILSAIGLHKVANFSKGLAWGTVIAIFLVGILFLLAGDAVTDMVPSN